MLHLGSRRLITYKRLPDADVDPETVKGKAEREVDGRTADELNPFRRDYFKGFT
jgi:tRNA (guanine10-N2)-methyltransferase